MEASSTSSLASRTFRTPKRRNTRACETDAAVMPAAPRVQLGRENLRRHRGLTVREQGDGVRRAVGGHGRDVVPQGLLPQQDPRRAEQPGRRWGAFAGQLHRRSAVSVCAGPPKPFSVASMGQPTYPGDLLLVVPGPVRTGPGLRSSAADSFGWPRGAHRPGVTARVLGCGIGGRPLRLGEPAWRLGQGPLAVAGTVRLVVGKAQAVCG